MNSFRFYLSCGAMVVRFVLIYEFVNLVHYSHPPTYPTTFYKITAINRSPFLSPYALFVDVGVGAAVVVAEGAGVTVSVVLESEVVAYGSVGRSVAPSPPSVGSGV